MPTFTLDPVAPSSCFAMNMAILSRRCPRLVERLLQTPARSDVVFIPGDDPGTLSGEMGGVALASRRRPVEEAERLVAGFDVRKAGGLLVLGFGLGHHVAAACRRLRRAGVVVVFEPDLGLLRAVLEQVDHSAWMAQFPFLIIDDPDDAGAMSEAIRGYEAPLAVGIEVLEHPASRQRLGEASGRFTESFTRVVSAMRTHVITTMVQTDVTLRNVLMNADAYVSSPGIDDLAGIAQGQPAIVVSAGPSLARTIAELKRPGLRDRCVIVAVQTVLKQLLAEGIKPHFVTALDYHEISRRFYEGLTAADVEGVTLIAEPRANPAIIEAWPGDMRMTGDKWLDDILGPEIAGPHAQLRAGATVAHLAYYVARHLGCDPVILTGQDLAFTDGQYYAAGAAIHQVWSGELSMFNTLEMMEWQRIVRMRSNLRRVEDHLGRPVYTDDQMATYLAQFERDFGTDAAQGLTTIDATEGGVRKPHTSTMTMREALNAYAEHSRAAVPSSRRCGIDRSRVDRAVRKMESVRGDIRRIGRLSRETLELLRKMKQHHGDEQRVNRIIRDVHKLRDEVQSMTLAFELVQRLNQTGSFKRYRADREIMLADALSPLEKQLRQIDRDITNVQWIVDVTEVFDDLLAAAADAATGKAPKRTRDMAPRELEEQAERVAVGTERSLKVGALLAVPSDAMDAQFLGKVVVCATLERLIACDELDSITLVTDDPRRARAIAEGFNIDIVEDSLEDWKKRRERVTAARRWSRDAWRGGIAHLTCYDEVLDPISAQRWMERAGLDGFLLAGADWCLIDPVLTGRVIERFREQPDSQPLAFTQAAPGLVGSVLGRDLIVELAKGQRENIIFASLGGLLGYIPTNARPDPIVKPFCLGIDPAIRDVGWRCIPDDALSRRNLEAAIGSVSSASAMEVAGAWQRFHRQPGSPRFITAEINSDTDLSKLVDVIERMVRAEASSLNVTLRHTKNALPSPSWTPFMHRLAAIGCGLHLRTLLHGGERDAELIAAWPLDVVSIDVLANSPATYQAIHGMDAFHGVLKGIERLVKDRAWQAGLPCQWVVPRITRCDQVYAEIEAFYDAWLLLAGAAVIDQMPDVCPGERITPLGKPGHIAQRDAAQRLFIRAGGDVWADERGTGALVGNVWTDGIDAVWSRRAAAPQRWTGW